MKNKHQFQQAVTTASRVLGGNLGARVVFSGDQAKTDGKTITIPQLPENAMITEHEEAITTGYYCHESAHIRYSEMDYLLKEMTDAADAKDELFKSLINAVEDCYIEREWTNEYEGSKNPLSDAHRTVDTKALTYMAQDEAHASDFRHIGPMGLTWMSGREKGYDGVVRERCINDLGEGMEQKLHDWYEKYVKPVKCSRDSVRAARAIADEMIEYQKQQEQEQSEQGQPEDQQCDGGQGNGEGEEVEVEVEIDPSGTETTGQSEDGEDDADKVDGDQGNGDQPDGTEDVGDTTGQGGGDGGDLAEKSPVVPMPVDIDIREALDVDAKRSESNAKGEMQYMPFTEEYDAVLTRRQDAPTCHTQYEKWERVFHDGHWRGKRFKTGQSAYNKMLSETQGALSVMRRKIQRAFMTKMNREWTGGHETGRLNPRDLVRAYQGVDKVYRQRSDAPDIDTSVQILVDASSSMNGPAMRCAAVTSIALCQTLDAIGCETEVITFDGCDSRDAWTAVEEEQYRNSNWETQQFYSRMYPMSLVAHKEFDEPLRQVQTALGNMLVMPDGGTPTADAIMIAYRRLLVRPSSRKIMLIVTDGMANNRPLCRQAIKHIQRKDIEVAGIGIGGDFIGNWCDRSIAVRQVDDLASKVMDDFAKMLLGERFNASNVKGEAA